MALRNDPRISPGVRQRIHALAQRRGYQLNPVVSRLLSQIRSSQASTRQGTLAVLNTSEHAEDSTSAFTRAWLTAARRRADELGFWVDEFFLHEKNLTPERLLDVLEARNIRGLLVTGPFANHRIPAALEPVWRRSSAVVVGERTTEPPLDCVVNNQFLTALMAMDQCFSLGYRRPALCIHPDLDRVVENRFLAGFLVAQRRWPVADRVPEHFYQPTAEKEFSAWFKRHHPDVILTLHPEIRDWLGRLGATVPNTVGLVHLDCAEETGSWSGMRQDHEHLGSAAVEMLVNHIYHHEVGVPSFQKCLLLGSRWIEGKTTLRQTAFADPRSSKSSLPAKESV